MSLISKWFAEMQTVPARVYFVAFVFGLSTLHVSQEAGMVLAQQKAYADSYPVATSYIDAALVPEERQALSSEEFFRQKRQLSKMTAVVKKVEARIAALNKQGVATPNSLRDQLNATKAAIASVESADSFTSEGVQSAMHTIRQSGDALRSEMQRYELLSQTPRMLKQAQTEIKNLETRLARSEKRLATLTESGSAYGESLGEFRQAVAFIKSGYARAQEQQTSGNTENAMKILRSDVWDQLSTAQRLAATVEGLGQTTEPKIDYSVFSGS